MIIVDAKNQILGRLASFVAKKALLGEEVKVVNAELAVITGKRDEIISKYKTRRERGIPSKGPFIPRMPDRFVRRAIRGMVPYSKPRGREAFKRILCYKGIPAEFEGKDLTNPQADVSKVVNVKYMTVNEITKILGAKE